MALRACSKPRPAVLIEYQPGPGHLLAVARLDGRPVAVEEPVDPANGSEPGCTVEGAGALIAIGVVVQGTTRTPMARWTEAVGRTRRCLCSAAQKWSSLCSRRGSRIASNSDQGVLPGSRNNFQKFT